MLVGVQSVELEEYGGSLRPAVRQRISRALDIAADYLSGHGFSLVERTDEAAGNVITPGLDLTSYDGGRPDAASACRHGDARVLAREAKA